MISAAQQFIMVLDILIYIFYPYQNIIIAADIALVHIAIS